MIFRKMFKIFIFALSVNLFMISNAFGEDKEFDSWVKNFKIRAINSGISKNVVNEIMSNAKFLPKVIQYDRFQPEFYEEIGRASCRERV